MLQIGLRAHDIGSFSPSELGKQVASYGFRHIQLAMQKALTDHDKSIPLNPGYARNIAESLAKNNVHISILGCYINPVHPDAEKRETGLRRFEDHLRMSRSFGSSIVATETGSVNADNSWNDNNQSERVFMEFVDSVLRLVDCAQKFGCHVGIEGVAGKNIIYNVERMQRMLELIPSPNLGVIYDPVNFLPDSMLHDHKAHIRLALDMFSDKILAIHAKDYAVENGKKVPTLPLGAGNMDYDWFFSELEKRHPHIEVLLENNSPQSLPESLAVLKELGYHV